MSEKNIFRQYRDLFDKHLGKLLVEYEIKLDLQVKPVRLPRCIPIEMQDKVKSELDGRMVKLAKM